MTEREFNKYIDKVRPKLLYFASSIINKGAATAEDMVQDATIKVWKEQKESIQGIRNMDALTNTVLRNVCLDYLRLPKNKAERKVEISSIREDALGFSPYRSNPQTNMEIKEQIGKVSAAIESLSKEQQIVIRLRDIMGYEFSQIAIILNTSEGNIRTMLSRSRKQIRLWILEN